MLTKLKDRTFSCNCDIGYVVVVMHWTVCREGLALVEFC